MSAESNRSSVLRWRISDIVLTVVIGVASGVIFWGFDFAYGPAHHVLKAITPGLESLLYGVYYLAGPLAIILVRKVGAAIIAEVIGALVEVLLGSLWSGIGVLLPGLIQGVGAELAFIIVAYRVWNPVLAALSGFLAATGGFIVQWPLYWAGDKWQILVIKFIGGGISGAVIAGLLMWWLYCALAQTGALDGFASGRASRRERVEE